VASVAIKEQQQFHFLTSTLSIGLSSGDINFTQTLKERIQELLAMLFGFQDSNAPTYDLSDKGVEKTDINIHSAPLLIDGIKTVKRRRLGRHRY
jgi:hypothetical protein